MAENKSIEEQLTNFHKTIDDHENIEVNIEDEGKSHIFLSSLPGSFEHFKGDILYSKENTITLNEVQTTVRSKEVSKVKYLKIDDISGCLSFSRGENKSRRMSKLNRFDKSKVKWFTC